MTNDSSSQPSTPPYGPDPDFDPVLGRAAEAGADDACDRLILLPTFAASFTSATQYVRVAAL
jgi:hypothetical protein